MEIGMQTEGRDSDCRSVTSNLLILGDLQAGDLRAGDLRGLDPRRLEDFNRAP
jgi:hypothetical protein